MKANIRNTIAILFLALLCSLVFIAKFDGFFLTDDYAWINLARLANEGNLSALIQKYIEGFGVFRPLYVIILTIQFSLFGAEPLPYHLLGLLIHFLNCILIWRLGSRLLASEFYGFICAITFCLNLFKTSAVYWIAAIPDLLVTLCALIIVLVWLKHIRSRSITTYLICVGIFSISLLIKEIAIVLPFLLTACELFTAKSSNIRLSLPMLKIFWWKYFPFFSITAIYMVFQLVLFPSHRHLFSLKSFENIAGFVSFTFVPISRQVLNVVGIPPETNILPIIFLKVSIVLFITCAMTYLAFRGSPTSRLSLLWFLIPLIPISFFDFPLFSIPSAVNSWYLYLPSVGFSLLVVIFFRWLLERLKLRPLRILWGITLACYLAINAGGVVLYGNKVFQKKWNIDRKLFIQFDKLHKYIEKQDILYFNGDNALLRDIRDVDHFRSFLFVFWGLHNKFYLVYPEDYPLVLSDKSSSIIIGNFNSVVTEAPGMQLKIFDWRDGILQIRKFPDSR